MDEKTALANFKTGVETIGTWIEEKQKAAGSDPSAKRAIVGEIVGKLQAVKTDGLPAELKGAWDEMNVVLAELGEVCKTMPEIDAAKPEEMGSLMQDFLPKIVAIQTKVEPVAKKLQDVGVKYGLDLKKVAPGGK